MVLATYYTKLGSVKAGTSKSMPLFTIHVKIVMDERTLNHNRKSTVFRRPGF